MPYIHIQISGPSDDALAQRAAAASELTARLLHKDPSLTAVVIEIVLVGRKIRADLKVKLLVVESAPYSPAARAGWSEQPGSAAIHPRGKATLYQ